MMTFSNTAKAIAACEYLSEWPENLSAQQAFDAVLGAEELPEGIFVWEQHEGLLFCSYDTFVVSIVHLAQSVDYHLG